ncbi:hypothetical protein [Burkholderia ubonensis]|uniref:hypothetical protein n=1 Tax=Burkholderia ubonensis TaxID=101571 RepID=UPI000B1AC4B2|nr:hypothetical protein [Burkholderia ubonensis]
MNLDRAISVLKYTTILALGGSVFCVGVLWSCPLDVPAWFAATCASLGIALASGVGEIVLRRKRTGMPLKAAAR